MKLTDKIDSYEKYLEVIYPSGDRARDYLGSNGRQLSLWRVVSLSHIESTKRVPVLNGFSYVSPQHQWWMHREDARVHQRVYEPPTTVLMELHNNPLFAQYFVHISTKDPTQIAFTPSHADGLLDRQVHMSLGRFLRKYSLSFSDPEIAMLEGRHRSELSPDVKLHSFIDEWDTCLKVYKHISSCMGKDEGVFSSDVHPVSVYKAPGYHLAVLYNDRGTASARCIVYVNPDKPEDKRWVRVYGDAVLQTWLKNNGFAAKSLAGTWLYTHKLPNTVGDGITQKARILMAYLDPGSDRDARYHNGPAVWDGGTRMYLLPKIYDIARFPRAFIPQSTGGYLDVFSTPVLVKSVISGKEFNAMEQPFERVWAGNTTGYALKSETAGFISMYVNRTERLLCAPDTPYFTYNGYAWVESADLRVALGFFKLAPRYYPNEQEWIDPGTAGKFVRAEQGWIKSADTVFLIDRTTRSSVHASTVPENYERLASIDEVKTFATPGTRVVRTTANRKVVPGVHQVVEMYNGEWMYERHTTRVELFGTGVYVPKDAASDVLKGMGLPSSVKTTIAQYAAAQKRCDAVMRKVIYTYLMDRGDVFVPITHDKATSTFEWSYIWSASEVVVEPIRALLAAREPKHVGAIQAAIDKFTHLASLLVAEVDRCWAEKTAAESQPAPAEAA